LIRLYWFLLLFPCLLFLATDSSKVFADSENAESGKSASTLPVAENAAEKACEPINIEFIPNNVFSKEEPNYFWALGIANDLHVTTKESTLNRAMGSFRQCRSKLDPYEVERHYRRLPYIRDAKVSKKTNADGKDSLIIETWDNWSLQPNLSFGRKGGSNSWSIGIGEGNILGTGIASNVNYFSNNDRNGYVVGIQSPMKLGLLLNTAFNISNNNDGYKHTFDIESPFASKNTRWAFAFDFNNESRLTTLRKNGEDISQYRHNIRHSSFWWGFASVNPDKTYRERFRFGFTSNKNEFETIKEPGMPEDRVYSYPWIQYSYLSDKYTKMQNIYLINSIEDINLGVNFWTRFGVDISPSESSFPYIWALGFTKSTRMSKNWLFAFLLHGEGNALDNGSSRFVASGISELFYTPHPLFTLYSKLIFTFSENEYAESPVTLGDNTGLTGYPVQYSHGDHFFVYKKELRFYPKLSLFQLIEVGGALFYGLGKTFGKANLVDNNNELLQTVGFGLRLYSARSSDGNTLYLDFARPISKDENLNNWEWRLRGKSQF
jgi:hypothetical protein